MYSHSRLNTFEQCPQKVLRQRITLHRLPGLDLTGRRGVGDAEIKVLLAGRPASLQFLRLSGTSITEASLPLIVTLPRLKTLDVRKTRISQTGLLRLAQMPSLQKLNGRPLAVKRQNAPPASMPFQVSLLKKPTRRESHLDSVIPAVKVPQTSTHIDTSDNFMGEYEAQAETSKTR